MQKFLIINTKKLINTQCFYKKEDYSLFCEKIVYDKIENKYLIRNGIENMLNIRREEMFYIHAGYLTMSFYGENGFFSKLDAFVNYKIWKYHEIEIPKTKKIGILNLNMQNEIENNYTVYSTTSEFIYDPKQKMLKIDLFEKNDCDSFIKISNSIICGFKSNKLLSFYLLNIVII